MPVLTESDVSRGLERLYLKYAWKHVPECNIVIFNDITPHDYEYISSIMERDGIFSDDGGDTYTITDLGESVILAELVY